MSEWIDNTGSSPEPVDTMVQVKLRDDKELICRADGLSWDINNEHCDIVAYRKLKQHPINEGKAGHDEVNNPAHYDLFPDSQSIDIIKSALTAEEWAGFLKGNVLKYRLRAGEKGPAEKCIAKANWYKEKLWSEHDNQ